MQSSGGPLVGLPPKGVEMSTWENVLDSSAVLRIALVFRKKWIPENTHVRIGIFRVEGPRV